MSRITRVGVAAVIGTVCIAMVAACGGQRATADSPEARREAAGALTRLAVELGAFEQVLDDGADWAQTASADTLKLELGRELTDEESARVREIMRSVLSEFVKQALWEEAVIAVYVENFTAAELEAMLAFYGSPVGRKSLELERTLAAEVDAAVETALEGQLEEFIDRIDDELAEAFEGLDSGADS